MVLSHRVLCKRPTFNVVTVRDSAENAFSGFSDAETLQASPTDVSAPSSALQALVSLGSSDSPAAASPSLQHSEVK